MSDLFNSVDGRPDGISSERRQTARDSDYTVQLPPADELAKYEEISPGIADRILTVIEKENERNMDQVDLQRRRIDMTTTVSLSLIGVAGVGIWLGVFWPVILLLGLGGMATFLLRELIRR
jgi:uncharacterized membrane protein